MKNKFIYSLKVLFYAGLFCLTYTVATKQNYSNKQDEITRLTEKLEKPIPIFLTAVNDSVLTIINSGDTTKLSNYLLCNKISLSEKKKYFVFNLLNERKTDIELLKEYQFEVKNMENRFPMNLVINTKNK